MGAIPGSVSITGFLATTDSTDTYAVIDPLYGVDGLRSVLDHSARNAISDLRRREGMITYTRNDGFYWKLLPSPWTGNDADWTLFSNGPTIAITSGPVASLPSPGNSGNLYLTTDSVYLFHDTGTSWQAFGDIYPLTPPTNNLSIYNPGSPVAVYTESGGGGVFYGISQAGMGGVDTADFVMRMWTTSIPSTPYTLTMSFDEIMSPLFTFGYFGMVLLNSGSGQFITYARGFNGGWVIHQGYYDSPTVKNSTNQEIDINHPHEMMRFLRLSDDGTNRTYSCSNDGVNYLSFKTEASGTFVIPDQIGVFVQQTDSVEINYGMLLTHWSIL
jgi:hypothetical protein